jgi:hypothetical protein
MFMYLYKRESMYYDSITHAADIISKDLSISKPNLISSVDKLQNLFDHISVSPFPVDIRSVNLSFSE